MRSPSPRGLARGLAVGALVGATLLDLDVVRDGGYSPWATVAVLAAGLAAVLWPAGRRPAWLTPQLRTGVPALLSLLFTLSAVVLNRDAPFGLGEAVLLLCLLFVAVRNCPPRWAVLCGVLDGGALLATPARYYGGHSDEVYVFSLAGLVLVGVVAGLAAYLRALDYRRTVAVAETRREERLAIAADLHDFVAHHVTGILVQTQMARMMAAGQAPHTSQTAPAPTPTQELDPVLAGIERAATEALASMRRTVGVLRDTGPGPDTEAADRRPVGDLAALTELTEGFASPGQQVTLRRDPAVTDDLPHEVQAAAFRVVQEALTNVRRHAADATEIVVALRCDGNRLEVTVSDDGRGGTQLPAAAHGGGFGLVGLTERVTALGGRLHTGPRAEHGWEVRAVFPTP
ncbi:sensor histidine kinase [Streptomyces lincolnensis]|uniref:sensor histidine kinase n=1 Tax=Streptomyces lincolnensis TaxID=1915 RepID=UPI001E5AFFFA|nr:histidine kinase [Streptomyces lincolnensis]MCD7440442.1 sensor histidine kinase [Streptomyces lincolnensis]